MQAVEGESVKSGVEERSTSHITSVTTIVKDSSVSHVSDRPGEGGEEEEEEEDPAAPQSLDIVLPAGWFHLSELMNRQYSQISPCF